MRHGSQISATAQGTANGGNITINTPFIVAVPSENSDIIATAINVAVVISRLQLAASLASNPRLRTLYRVTLVPVLNWG